MSEYIPLNLELMSHPANWLVITLMVLIGGFALALITGRLSAGSDSQ
jgi:hypothetical protein